MAPGAAATTSAATHCPLGAATMANDATHRHPRAPTTSLRATIVVASMGTRRLNAAARIHPGPRATALTPTLVLSHGHPRLPTHALPLTTAMVPNRRDLLHEPVANHHLPRIVVTRARDGHRGRCDTTRRHTVNDPVTAATMLHAPTNDPRRSPPAANIETTRT